MFPDAATSLLSAEQGGSVDTIALPFRASAGVTGKVPSVVPFLFFRVSAAGGGEALHTHYQGGASVWVAPFYDARSGFNRWQPGLWCRLAPRGGENSLLSLAVPGVVLGRDDGVLVWCRLERFTRTDGIPLPPEAVAFTDAAVNAMARRFFQLVLPWWGERDCAPCTEAPAQLLRGRRAVSRTLGRGGFTAVDAVVVEMFLPCRPGVRPVSCVLAARAPGIVCRVWWPASEDGPVENRTWAGEVASRHHPPPPPRPPPHAPAPSPAAGGGAGKGNTNTKSPHSYSRAMDGG